MYHLLLQQHHADGLYRSLLLRWPAFDVALLEVYVTHQFCGLLSTTLGKSVPHEISFHHILQRAPVALLYFYQGECILYWENMPFIA